MSNSPVLVEPPLPGGGRPVRIHGKEAGVVRSPGHLVRLMRDAGSEIRLENIDETLLVEWVGGGVETW